MKLQNQWGMQSAFGRVGLAAALSLGLGLSSLTGNVEANTLNQTPTITVDGSSTVFPISEGMAEEFQKMKAGAVRVTVGVSGTGGGFRKFCAGETDVQNASRPITAREIEACKQAGISYVELPVAFDGLSVIVSPRNEFVECMTTSELKKLWEPEAQGTITRWNQIRPEWPDRQLRLYGPGTDSGTFDYFTEVINGRSTASRGDYTASEDDNVLVQGVSNDINALGYFGHAYYEENADRLKLVAVDAEKGGGCVYASNETIAGGSYVPLSRPIFIYVKASALERPEVREFAEFYTSPANAATIVPQVGYTAFPSNFYEMGGQRLAAMQLGTVFGGQAAQGATLADLFNRTPMVP